MPPAWKIDVYRSPQLTHLWIEGGLISADGIRSLGELKGLRALELSLTAENRDGLEGLAHLPNLRRLGLGLRPSATFHPVPDKSFFRPRRRGGRELRGQ